MTEERKHKEMTKLCTAEEIVAIEPKRGRNPSPKERKVATEIVPVAESRTIKRQRLVPPPNRNLESKDVSPATSPSSDLPSPRAHALQSPGLTATSRDTPQPSGSEAGALAIRICIAATTMKSRRR